MLPGISTSLVTWMSVNGTNHRTSDIPPHPALSAHAVEKDNGNPALSCVAVRSGRGCFVLAVRGAGAGAARPATRKYDAPPQPPPATACMSAATQGTRAAIPGYQVKQ
jgi:hypothetical protein